LLPVEVGDHRHLGRQIQEGGVAFVGLGHEVAVPAQDGVAAEVVPHGPHQNRRVQASGPEDRGGHGGGGGFAVGPGNGDLEMSLHKAGLHFAPAQDPAPRGPGRSQLGVVLFDRGGVNHYRVLGEVLRAVALKDPDAELLETPGDGALGHIGAAHPVALAHQEFRQAAHAYAADADEVVVLLRFTCHSNLLVSRLGSGKVRGAGRTREFVSSNKLIDSVYLNYA